MSSSENLSDSQSKPISPSDRLRQLALQSKSHDNLAAATPKTPRQLSNYASDLYAHVTALFNLMVSANCSEFRVPFGSQVLTVTRQTPTLRELGEFEPHLDKIVLLQRTLRHYYNRKALIAGLASFCNSNSAKTSRKRGNLLRELISTEESYHECLDKCCRHFLYALRSSELQLEHSFFSEVFMNIEDITDASRRFLAALQERMLRWPSVTTVGDVISSNIKQCIDHYARYLVGYKASLQQWSEQLQADPALQEWNRETLAQLRITSLADLMITPVQRLPRYQMILSGLIGCTDADHADRPLLTSCLDLIVASTSAINRCELERAEAIRVLETLDFGPCDPSLKQLLHYHGRLLAEGRVRLRGCDTLKKTASAHALLFNRALLLCHSGDRKAPVVQHAYQWTQLSPSDVVVYRHNDLRFFRCRLYEGPSPVRHLFAPAPPQLPPRGGGGGGGAVGGGAGGGAGGDAFGYWQEALSALLRAKLYKAAPELREVQHTDSTQALFGCAAVAVREAHGIAPVGDTFIQVEWLDQQNRISKKTLPQPPSNHPRYDTSLNFQVAHAIPDKSSLRFTLFDMGSQPPTAIGETSLPFFSFPDSSSKTMHEPLFSSAQKAMVALLHLNIEWIPSNDSSSSSSSSSTSLSSSSSSTSSSSSSSSTNPPLSTSMGGSAVGGDQLIPKRKPSPAPPSSARARADTGSDGKKKSKSPTPSKPGSSWVSKLTNMNPFQSPKGSEPELLKPLDQSSSSAEVSHFGLPITHLIAEEMDPNDSTVIRKHRRSLSGGSSSRRKE